MSIVILTSLGPAHLPECLSSLRLLDYPAGRVEVIIVDNGSRVDPTEVACQHYPGVRVVRLPKNEGFCKGNNEGARAARGEWVAFLNDDTRVDPGWLSAMVATANRRSAACVGARVLNWTGQWIDFAGAAMNFEAKGFQLGFGSDDLQRWSEERPLLFANGAAMLVDRSLFRATGGFNESYFIYYEDLAFGWQLWIRGHEVWFSPQAIVYHKHHATTGPWGSAARARLLERNALWTTFTHVESRNLRRILPAALLLAGERALLHSQLGHVQGEEAALRASWLRRFYWRAKPRTVWTHARAALAMRGAGWAHGVIGSLKRLGPGNLVAALWSTLVFLAQDEAGHRARRTKYLMEQGIQREPFDHTSEPVSAASAAVLAALQEWLGSLAEQREQRRQLQAHRRRPDADVLGRFPDYWTSSVPVAQQKAYDEAQEIVIREFGIAGIPLERGQR